ncbi:uncharacterized protein PHALS_05768 [Plasmopara halstedii]|uniref:Uncharacterized protein n=1 Tax=Plasmopara halstedii TaxID=4781 RepID=A0A0P1ABH0_PLAHL|nr:uncharacterized protein PHALS_05768 [Plasmopara halstedii]CEG37710.1 hypothetical protein PHALS_05768 [Plasmopara halstedii]|eukprot:XP_024574079.1 hypothetical protein PHALS_05768 [Plasmopara halstedii]
MVKFMRTVGQAVRKNKIVELGTVCYQYWSVQQNTISVLWTSSEQLYCRKKN